MTAIDRFRALPKDKGWAWMCLIGGLLMNTIMAGGIFKTFGVIFITVEAKYDASAAFLSWTHSTTVALTFLIGPLANALASRFCTRWLVITGAFIVSTGYVLSSLAGSQWVFLCTYGICIGVGSGLLYSPSIVVVNQYFEKKRGVANGISLAGSGIGSITIPPLMVYTLDTYGLEGTLLIMGGITLNLCVCGMLFRPAKFYMRRHCLKLERQRRIRAAVLDGATEPQGSGYVKHETGDTGDATNGGYVNPIAVGDTCLDKDTAIDQRCPHKADSPHKESLQHKETDSEASDKVNGTNEELNDVAIVQLCVGECRSYTDAQTNDKDDTTTEQLLSSAVRTDCPIKDR
ncbi:Monocarboxylate transporter 12 [Lamellibrachia satsuma]|nr:Monocarboxylate transporter 12 [Lamellibrachia satsuma]